MPWNDAARRDHVRRGPRHASDLTDWECAPITPLLPSPRRVGRPRTTDLREVISAILHIATTGCQWRMLPKDLLPASTVQRYSFCLRDSRCSCGQRAREGGWPGSSVRRSGIRPI